MQGEAVGPPGNPATAPDRDVIVARGLVKRYGDLTAVDHVDITVHAGEIFGLLGPNGAGKTTTLEMLEGLRNPDEGTALILGEPISESARRLKARIGVQLQATALPAFTRVAEAVELFAAFYPRARPTRELLEEFDLTAKSRALATTLSGGQMQRLSLALALVNEPELVFLDEPTTGLDPGARLSLWEVIENIRTQGRAVMLTTHYMEEAERLCDRVAVMNHGRIVAMDTPPRLIAAHAPGSTVEFQTARPLDAEVVSALPGVETSEVEGTQVRITTRSPEEVLAGIFNPAVSAAWAGGPGGAPPVQSLRVRAGTLEDVFINLTGRGLGEE